MSKSNDVVAHEPQPIFASLRDRLSLGHRAAQEAWAAKAGAGFKEVVVTLATAVKAYEVRVPEIATEEDLLRARADLAETLRSAASAIAPRAS